MGETRAWARWAAVGTGVVATVAAGAVAYTVAQVQARAAGDVVDYLSRGPGDGRPVVCLGASIVRGRASVDFVEILRQRMLDREFVNAGVNGNVVGQVRQRLGEVLACGPGDVVILVGTNDVLATLTSATGQVESAMDAYRATLGDVVQEIQESGARVTLCSLPPLGQDLGDAANARVELLNAHIRDVARQRETAYAPVHEALCTLLAEKGRTRGPAWTPSWRPGLTSLMLHFLLGWSYDRVAERAGWMLSPDGVHLDSVGAEAVAERVEECLRSTQSRGA